MGKSFPSCAAAWSCAIAKLMKSGLDVLNFIIGPYFLCISRLRLFEPSAISLGETQ